LSDLRMREQLGGLGISGAAFVARGRCVRASDRSPRLAHRLSTKRRAPRHHAGYDT
jgi:hypothetical protein